MNKIIEKSLKQKIERLEAFEERLHVKLENISIKVEEGNWFSLFCELYPLNGTKIKSNIIVECILYDIEGSIMQLTSNWIDSENFFGFEVLEFSFPEEGIIDKVGKIRIYPKKN
ncbi:MAG: hypothetical protein WAT92_18825 [Saprospiraceae bacterium]